MSERDYEALGLVAGLEIHQQLDTASKLFCSCPTIRREPADAVRTFTRYLHPTRSELGEIDDAALEESRVDREFEYLAYDSTCLVEEDDEPPGPLDDEALEVAIQIAQLLDMDPVDQIHVMRKIVIDGSNTSGFQRSALIAREGAIDTDAGVVSIDDLMLEEEAAQRLEETPGGVRYSLDRLGIPLVEIGTGPDIRSPEQARAAAERIGMLLRSTGTVKRGLGSIRQDVNVSIADGARVELKGVQRLDDIDDIVRLEVDRQVRLVDLADTLRERNASVADPTDVTAVFESTDSAVVRGAIDDDGVVVAVPLFGFGGLVGAEIQPGRRLGTEFADHARRYGAGGVFHTDELPDYGITDAEVSALLETLDAGPDDAVAFVAGPPVTARHAIDAVAARAAAAIDGVPEETRAANDDATSNYLRPLPGAARMYPETDVPPVVPDIAEVDPPELLTEKADRYAREHDLDPDLADQLAYSERMPLFERALEMGVDPALAARTVESTVTALRRDGVATDRLTTGHFEGVFDLLVAGDLAPEGVEELLTALADDPSLTAAAAAERAGLGRVDEAVVRETVVEVVDRNAEQVTEEGMDAFSALMGECMAELRGKADGSVVSRLLREEIGERAAS